MKPRFNGDPIKILLVVGARPNFMKAGPIIQAIHDYNSLKKGPCIRHLLVHTGQHYDKVMSDRFFADLGLPRPDVQLGVGSGSHAAQTAQIIQKFEGVLLREEPQVVVVVGDVNSTLACALVAAKISFGTPSSRPLIAHVEAGLRSFDRSMPEEINRILTDSLSDLLFVTEESGVRNLSNEGVSGNKIHFVGNTMIDSLRAFIEKAESSTILDDLGLGKKNDKNGTLESDARYALLTLHRPSNVDEREALSEILEGLEELASESLIIFPVHPRTQHRIKEFNLEPFISVNATRVTSDQVKSGRIRRGIFLISPLGYLDFLCLMKHASIVITDSGGIQEETTCLGVPCVTVRENTERPVTVEVGTNMIAGTSKEGIKSAIKRQFMKERDITVPKYWDGHAASRIIDTLVRVIGEGNPAQRQPTQQPCS